MSERWNSWGYIWTVILSTLQLLISSQSNTPAELKLFQPQEIVIIQVRGERVSRKQNEKGSSTKRSESRRISRVLSEFSLTLRPRKIQTLFFPIFVWSYKAWCSAVISCSFNCSDWCISNLPVWLRDLLPRRSAVPRISCCCVFWSWASTLLEFRFHYPCWRCQGEVLHELPLWPCACNNKGHDQ